MKRTRVADHRSAGAFTLIELLVVMTIIVILIGLLMPGISAAIAAARGAATRNIIYNLGLGLEAFKRDWNVYPPSDDKHEVLLPAPASGYQNLGVALMGPTAKGWGTAWQINTNLPFGATANAVYGPYFQPPAGSTSPSKGVSDAYPSPPRKIFYYRYEPSEPAGTGTNAPSSGLLNYRDNEDPSNNGPNYEFSPTDGGYQFRCSVTYKGPDNKYHWRREDYVLISPGYDRMYGHVTDADPPAAATQADIDSGKASYDDITNF